MEQTDANKLTDRPARLDQCHPLGLGCWVFGGAAWGGQDDEQSRNVMQASVDAGLNHFDTAIGYGGGKSEQLVGQFITEHQLRDQIYLATKGFMSQMTGEFARQQFEKSVANLGVDVVDLYYIHWPKSDTDMRPVMEELEKLRSEGKLRHIGVSNFSVEHMQQVAEVGRIDAHQMCYNLLWRHPEAEIMPYCRENDIAIVTYSSIAQGILTGKFPRHPEFPEGDQRPNTLPFREDIWPHLYEAVEQLKPLAEQLNRPLTHLAIRWVLAQPDIASVLVGARREDQLNQNVAAMDGDIPNEVFEQMTAISDEAVAKIPADEWNIFGMNP